MKRDGRIALAMYRRRLQLAAGRKHGFIVTGVQYREPGGDLIAFSDAELARMAIGMRWFGDGPKVQR